MSTLRHADDPGTWSRSTVGTHSRTGNTGVIRIGINGFGRIGRTTLRAALGRTDVEVVAVNDLLAVDHLAYLLRYDSVHGRLPVPVETDAGGLRIDGRPVRVSAEPDPAAIDWAQAEVDVVIEATGRFLDRTRAGAHLTAGASRVIISAPSTDETPVYVYGVNTDSYGGESVVSAASCTTNALAPVAKVLHERFGIVRGLMTTVHAVTASQNVVDGVAARQWRFGRGAFDNIIPAPTGAAKAVARVIPDLAGKLTGTALRVPVSDVSVVDLTCQLNTPTSYPEVCGAMREAAAGSLAGVLGYTDEPVVSTDLRGQTYTSIFDATAGLQLDPTFIKIMSWYDNEWAYAAKLLDLATLITR